MYTVELDDEELRLVRSAIQAFVHHFGHDEADVLHAMQNILAKCPEPTPAAR